MCTKTLEEVKEIKSKLDIAVKQAVHNLKELAAAGFEVKITWPENFRTNLGNYSSKAEDVSGSTTATKTEKIEL